MAKLFLATGEKVTTLTDFELLRLRRGNGSKASSNEERVELHPCGFDLVLLEISKVSSIGLCRRASRPSYVQNPHLRLNRATWRTKRGGVECAGVGIWINWIPAILIKHPSEWNLRVPGYKCQDNPLSSPKPGVTATQACAIGALVDFGVGTENYSI
jgi:hypothetical protein